MSSLNVSCASGSEPACPQVQKDRSVLYLPDLGFKVSGLGVGLWLCVLDLRRNVQQLYLHTA